MCVVGGATSCRCPCSRSCTLLRLLNNFLLYPTSLECYTQKVYSPKKVIHFGNKALRYLFIVANGNRYIEFYEAIFKVWLFLSSCTYHYVCCALFVATNFSSSLGAEQTENGEIVVQQILARVAVRGPMRLLIGKNNVRDGVACYHACAMPRNAE